MTDTPFTSQTYQRAQPEYRPISSWFFPHPHIWLFGLLLVCIEIIWIFAAGFTFEFGSTLKPFILAGAAVSIAAGFSMRKMDYLAIAIFSATFFVFFGKIANVANYLSHAIGMPWADANLARVQAALGIDWLAILKYFNTHDLLATLTMTAYDYLRLWSFLTVIVLLMMQNHERLREFILLFASSAIITIIIGALLPAAGTYHYYQPDSSIMNNINPAAGRFFLPQLIGVHDSTITHINLGKVVGLITFPSFHTVMALLIAWSMRGTMLFPPTALISTAIILGTPVFGGHYIPDIIGGALVTICCIAGYYKWSGRRMGMAPPRPAFPILPFDWHHQAEEKSA